MKHVALVALLALVALSSVACTRGGSEDDAYDLVKSRASKELNCSDITVRKMAQDGGTYEYQATGCDDIYTYAVECSSRCEITAGVRGHGIGGLWNAAGKLISGIANDLEDADKRQAEMRERHRKMQERHDRHQEAIDQRLDRMDERLRSMSR